MLEYFAIDAGHSIKHATPLFSSDIFAMTEKADMYEDLGLDWKKMKSIDPVDVSMRK